MSEPIGMRDKLIQILKSFKAPVAKGLVFRIPAVEKLADHLLANDITLSEEVDKYKVVNHLLERDIADRDEMLKKKVEEVYPEFMRDYKCMEEELDGYHFDEAEFEAQVRADTVRKMAERLHIMVDTMECKGDVLFNSVIDDIRPFLKMQIDHHAKEMLEDVE